MHWSKLKNIFCPDKLYSWMWSHAANPVPWVLDETNEIVRIFFTSRSKENISYIGYLDCDFKNDKKIIKISDLAVVSPGEPGVFDDDGTAMGYLIEKNNKYYLYYLGWNLKVNVPWLNTIGLAVSENINGPYTKTSRAPLMDRSNEDPFSISYPCILFDEGKYKMWYGSNLKWGKLQEEMNHVIKYAESDDLLHWKRTNEIHIQLEYKNEYAISKPWVIKNEKGYHMWYSFRGNDSISNYRIGYAFSLDGKNWIRKDDQVGIDVSDEGWDSEMISYASVFILGEKTYMLYNGNGFGRTGFGLAILN